MDFFFAQTQELRTVLDSRVENDQLEFKSPTGFGSAFVGSECSESVSNSPQSLKGIHISPQTRRTLCEIYIRNVDPLFKLLHRPSLRAFLHDDQPYLDYEHDHQAPTTLAFAVFSVAVCTIDDSQCQLLFGLDKKNAFADLQKETEAALVKADFITTNDLTVLQAFVLSLVSFSLNYLPKAFKRPNMKLTVSSWRLGAKIRAGECGPC